MAENKSKRTKEEFAKAKECIKKILGLDRTLKSLTDYADSLEKETEKLVQDYIDEKIENQLKLTPVEELSKAKLGIRPSALRAAGIVNMYQLSRFPSQRLSNINGIGPKTAEKIRYETNNIVNNIKKSVKFRISPYDQYGAADAIVRNLYQVNEARQTSAKAKQLYDASHENISKFTKDGKIASSKLRWFFASDDKKEKALNSLKVIETMLNSGYAPTVEDYNSEREKQFKAEHDAYWKDFNSNSAMYYATYDSIKRKDKSFNRSSLKKAEATAISNGLPADLAIAVSKVDLNLTGLKANLRPYQEYGVKFILKQGAVLLGDDMGLGKTVEAITTMVCLKNKGDTHFMVVCPASVLTNWLREIEKHSDLKPIKVHGGTTHSGFETWIENGGVAVTTYETTSKLDIPEKFSFSLLVADEAHYVKNPNAKRTQALLKFRKCTDRALFMTGTALENNVNEMYFLISCLQPKIANDIRNLNDIRQAERFRERVYQVYFRRKKEDVLDELPEKTEQEIWCELTNEEKAIYARTVNEGNFMAMRQLSWNVPDITKSSKGEQLKNLCEEAMSRNKKVLVFSFFRNTIEQVQNLLGENCYGPISGSVSPAKRQEIVDEFTNHEGGAVLVSQIGAGGTGMNIQAASVVIICEPQLKPSIESQAIARSYRMGQNEKVLVYRLLCEKTVDQRVLLMLERKKKIFEEFADKSASGEESIEISANDFASIIAEEQAMLKEAV